VKVDEMANILDIVDFPTGKEYANYLRTVLPRVATTLWPTMDKLSAMLKQLMLPLAWNYDNGQFEAFHLWLFIKVEILTLECFAQSRRSWTDEAVEKLEGEVYRELMFFTECDEHRASHCPADCQDPWTNYHDYARAHRTLSAAMSSVPCNAINQHSGAATVYSRYRSRSSMLWKEPHKHRKRHHDPACFHEDHASLLEFLQKRSYGEVRFRVISTIGTKLPADLTEMVFEHAMAAENAPLKPRVLEKRKLWADDVERLRRLREKETDQPNYVEEEFICTDYQCPRTRSMYDQIHFWQEGGSPPCGWPRWEKQGQQIARMEFI
jgi:hypothetical protein